MINISPNLLLSICIPTRGRNDILQKTLNSIFNSNVHAADYEVVIYDSSDNDELKNILLEYYPYTNLVYKQGKNNGFLNLVEALKMGQGAFLKLHNDYSELSDNALQAIIDQIKANLTDKPLLFYTNDSLKNVAIKACPTFDNFLYNISYQSSWSTAFGTWKTDFERIRQMELNPMFPHTSLLFSMPDKQHYLINNHKLFNNQEIGKKGGYNLFNTFAVTYLGMVNDCLKNGLITENTFKHIKKDMLENFLIAWYCDTKILKNQYTFILSGIKSSMGVYYSNLAYYKMVVFAYIKAAWKLMKNALKLAISNNK